MLDKRKIGDEEEWGSWMADKRKAEKRFDGFRRQDVAITSYTNCNSTNRLSHSNSRSVGQG